MRKFYIVGRRRLIRHGMQLVANGLSTSVKELGFEPRTFLIDRNEIGKVPPLKSSDILCVLCYQTMSHFGKALCRIGGTLCLYNFTEIFVGGSHRKTAWLNGFRDSVEACGREPDAIFNYSPLPIEWLRGHGYAAAYLPLGYSPVFEQKESLQKKRYDVSLLGTKTWRAKRRALLIRKLEGNGLRVGRLIRSPHIPRDNADKVIDALWKRNREFLRCKIWLNYHRRIKAIQGFADIRVVGWGMSNRLCVLSEKPCGWTPPFEDGVHWVQAEARKCLSVVRDILRDGRWRDIGQAGYSFVKNNWRYVDHIRYALDESGVGSTG